jgi:hypothetical protein
MKPKDFPVRRHADDLTEIHAASRRQPARHSLHDPPFPMGEITADSVVVHSSTGRINI